MDYVAIAIVAISLLISIISLSVSLKTKKRYEKYLKALGNGSNLATELEKYIKQVNELNKKDDEIIDYILKLKEAIELSLSKAGIERYSAYGDSNVSLSFALCLLNLKNDGFVINNIYSEGVSSVSIKQIKNGVCDKKLSDEEQAAVVKAISK